MVNQVANTAPRIDPWLSDDDNAGSGMEDNRIDHMVAPKKRQMKLSESFQGSSKRQKPQNNSTPRVSKGQRQPKITSTLGAA